MHSAEMLSLVPRSNSRPVMPSPSAIAQIDKTPVSRFPRSTFATWPGDNFVRAANFSIVKRCCFRIRRTKTPSVSLDRGGSSRQFAATPKPSAGLFAANVSSVGASPEAVRNSDKIAMIAVRIAGVDASNIRTAWAAFCEIWGGGARTSQGFTPKK